MLEDIHLLILKTAPNLLLFKFGIVSNIVLIIQAIAIKAYVEIYFFQLTLLEEVLQIDGSVEYLNPYFIEIQTT